MKPFLLTLVQMRVDGGKAADNLERARICLEAAARLGAKVVLLPEALDVGWTHPSSRRLAGAIPGGRSYETLREAAQRQRIYVCAGLVEKAGRKIYNAAVLIAPDGELLIHHRKLNELEIGHPYYEAGDRLQVAHTPLGTFGVMICADAFARGQVIARTLGYMGAQVILSPSAWAVPANHNHEREPYGQLWRDNYGPVARDFRLWIAGASCVGSITGGPWKGRRCIGYSLVVGPPGEPVISGSYGVNAEEFLTVEIKAVPRPTWGEGWIRRWKRKVKR